MALQFPWQLAITHRLIYVMYLLIDFNLIKWQCSIKQDSYRVFVYYLAVLMNN